MLLCLALAALASGSPEQHASPGQRRKPSRTLQSSPASKLRAAARVLEEISARSNNGIPDRVLNITKCLVVIPFIKGGTASASASGVSTCREAATEWSAPAFVQFNGRGMRAQRIDLLVFVLRGQGLRSGELQIEGEKQTPPPLVKTNPIVTQAELNKCWHTNTRPACYLAVKLAV